MIALTITIPNWLFCPEFWGGFFLAIGLCFALFIFMASKFSPFK